jgi:uncharacterized membrane protein YfcA
VYGAKLVAKFNPNTLKTLFGRLFLYVSLKYILIYFTKERSKAAMTPGNS